MAQITWWDLKARYKDVTKSHFGRGSVVLCAHSTALLPIENCPFEFLSA